MGRKLTEAEHCAICLDSFKKDETVCGSHSCQHQYHRNCISSWLKTHDECPVCRRNFLALPDKISRSVRPSAPTAGELDIGYELVDV